MEGLVLIVVIGATILAGGAIAGRLRIAEPLLLLVLGAALGFAPRLSGVVLPPDVVLLLFLPALLYWESLNISLREIRSNLRAISFLAVGLVFATSFVVALIGEAFGLSWPVALVLGAVLAPTDATAVASVVGRLPRRTLTILRTESLINDGTALVLYSIAVADAVSGSPIRPGSAALRFVLSYGVGAAIGLAVGFAAVGVRRLLRGDRLLNSTLSALTPYVAYLPAFAAGVSGVVAVVTCGVTLSQLGPKVITASMRAQSFGFWQLTTYLLNGALFVLIGLELHHVAGGLGSGWARTVGLGLLCAAAVIGVRLAWNNTTPYLIRMLDRRPSQRLRRQGFRERLPLGWAGFRGAISLAAALALPVRAADGRIIEGRSVVIAVTFTVILVTLVVQGLTMPAVVRWADLPRDPRELDEELLAEQATLESVLEALPGTAARIGSPDSAVEALRGAYERMLGRIHREEGSPQLARRDETAFDQESALRLALLPVKREALFALRDQGLIDDVVLRRVQARLDLDELRLSDTVEQE
ncbi:Na+/H+ antiporter [Streptantibioticus silvisoli]|uniref:Na+/H+ antiporter n=1 Tax=Streptantibioticus silvisoli TaxID=2705255 RepID=A0ABT6W3T9_9ACTN|nr:Na+/H+ antiporter [Streptantibioticus silvisoli]MDI5965413.1 Na+/H+ antiporter [Streptantibioticus silvisoli]